MSKEARKEAPKEEASGAGGQKDVDFIKELEAKLQQYEEELQDARDKLKLKDEEIKLKNEEILRLRIYERNRLNEDKDEVKDECDVKNRRGKDRIDRNTHI